MQQACGLGCQSPHKRLDAKETLSGGMEARHAWMPWWSDIPSANSAFVGYRVHEHVWPLLHLNIFTATQRSCHAASSTVVIECDVCDMRSR